MATTPPVIQAKITSDPVKLPLAPLLVSVVVGVVVATAGVGGMICYLLRSGKVPIRVAGVAPVVPTAPLKTHMVALEPLLVNLADPSGSAFLRAGITLSIEDPAEDKGKETNAGEAKPSSKDADAALRDTALTVLGQQTSDQLLAANGKERLKAELKSALAEHNPTVKVADLFFTEFLVQR
ncbi:flagellar basal body-associated FliL family protein [Edaphobacter sp. HDX4]|uniref:flagellar basal body-associated FliL family protein n=1 Tax=Edaphobacter sp. HDX4 TaxID=2794064 RepID=UPI002FE64F1C